jgi:hypothetical protein
MPSLAIRTHAYDPDRNELTVRFTNGRGYVYSLVPPAFVAALEAARSKGAFLNAEIKVRCPFRKLGVEPSAELRAVLAASAADDPA